MHTNDAAFDNVFGSMTLPVRPTVKADGAMIQLIEEEAVSAESRPFFGGYAEDMLADIGMESVAGDSKTAVQEQRLRKA